MRRSLAIAVALALLGAAGAASAQSGQGGYLGINPGKNVGAAQQALVPPPGSQQGGYLGANPGGSLKPLKPATPAEYLVTPAAWCVNSVEPSRCRSRAADDHAWCLQRGADNYASCRRTMDFMGWRP
jgi:hypothetical protein